MLLKKVTIHKYKSFLTEQSYTVEDRITRIVGKNESGKTALLEALAKSNYFEDNADFQFDKDLDYPRSELIKAKTRIPLSLLVSTNYPMRMLNLWKMNMEKGLYQSRLFF